MRSKLISFFLLYILVPLIIIPYLSSKSGNWFGLFGIGFYYIGFFIARFKQWIFFPIPLFFCLWYWYTYGFGLRDYVTIYLFCMSAGMIIYLLYDEYNKYIHRVIPEQEQSSEYNDKLVEMEQMIEKYRKDHPGEKITQEIIDRIKTEVFFN